MTDQQLPRDNTLAYSTSLEHLADEFKRLDVLLHLQVLKQTQPSGPLDQFQGLVISAEEIVSLFERHQLADAIFADNGDVHHNQTLVEKLFQLDATIQRRKKASEKQGHDLSLPRLSRLFQLGAFEEQCLIASLAPEIGRWYEKVYAFLQDDVTRKKPSLDLVLNLLHPKLSDKLAARAAFAPTSPLLYYRLLQITDSPPENPVPLISRFLKLDDRIVDFLLGGNAVDARLSVGTHLVVGAAPGSLTLSQEVGNRVLEFINKYFSTTTHFNNTGSDKNVVFYLHGRYGSGRTALAKWVSSQLGRPLLVTDVRRLLDGQLPFADMVRLLCRETILQPAVLCLENFDCLMGDDYKSHYQLELLCTELEANCRLAFVLGSKSWKPQGLLTNSQFVELTCTVPDEISRNQCWTHHLNGRVDFLGERNITELASKFQLTEGQMLDALRDAKTMAYWREPGTGQITIEDLHIACRNQSSHELNNLAQKIEPRYGWPDIVLPDDQLRQLHEITSHVKYKHVVMTQWGFRQKFSLGHGVTALFAGPSGTGKTMAAEVIAKDLSLELYKVDLSGVVSKYIGETEKNLNRIFTAANDSNAILFIDEADALFGKRSEVKDAHDRYANIEIAYLLQKMEEYSGIVILATNLKTNMDDAFVRRLRFIVDFPFPDEKQREKIWLTIVPHQVPQSDEISFSTLAKKVNTSGGGIKNISLRAAYFAAAQGIPLTMSHLVLASTYELKKGGALFIDTDLKGN